MGEILTGEEIEALFPSEWVLLGDPQTDSNQRLLEDTFRVRRSIRATHAAAGLQASPQLIRESGDISTPHAFRARPYLTPHVNWVWCPRKFKSGQSMRSQHFQNLSHWHSAREPRRLCIAGRRDPVRRHGANACRQCPNRNSRRASPVGQAS